MRPKPTTIADRVSLLKIREFLRNYGRDQRPGEDIFEAEARYKRVLAYQEDQLTPNALDWWKLASGADLEKELDKTVTLKEHDGAKLVESGGFYIMSSWREGTHRISADPSITSPERLEAHWKGFLFEHDIAPPVKLSNRMGLRELIPATKKVSMKVNGGDFACNSGQLLAIDEFGERITGGPIAFFDGCPTVKQIRDILRFHPETVRIIAEGQTYFLGDPSLNIVERRSYEHREPADWWQITIEP